jgi:hypothetical protein
LVRNNHARIAEFIKPGKRDRYQEMLCNPRHRHEFTSMLAHFADFDPKFRLPIRSNKLFKDNIARELRKRHSPNLVYAISESPAIDDTDLPLDDALEEIVGRGIGTVLSCIPGRLAFVETEIERFILERHELPENREYIRFVIGQKDDDSHVEQGIFSAAAQALDSQIVIGHDADHLNELRTWFNKNLQAPTAFGRGSLHLGICWFKTASTEHISKIWEMIDILERNGIYVKKIRTNRPGYIIYEDEWQLVAEPFRQGTI